MKGVFELKEQLQAHLMKRVKQCVSNSRHISCEKIERKKKAFLKEKVKLLRLVQQEKLITNRKSLSIQKYFIKFISNM